MVTARSSDSWFCLEDMWKMHSFRIPENSFFKNLNIPARFCFCVLFFVSFSLFASFPLFYFVFFQQRRFSPSPFLCYLDDSEFSLRSLSWSIANKSKHKTKIYSTLQVHICLNIFKVTFKDGLIDFLNDIGFFPVLVHVDPKISILAIITCSIISFIIKNRFNLASTIAPGVFHP